MLSSQELADIEKDASNFRERMGVPEDEKLDMLDTLRRMKFAGEIKNVSFLPSSIIGKSSAQFDPAADSITVSNESIDRQSARDRFTYAHEIGHKIGDHKFLRHRKNGKQFGSQIGLDEEYANAFAAALLVPEHLAKITEDTTVSDLVSRFGVSRPMATLRLLELQKRYRNKHGIRRPLPVPTGSEVSEFDSGDYEASVAQMSRNAVRWNAL